MTTAHKTKSAIESSQLLAQHLPGAPEAAIVLGSGVSVLNDLIDSVSFSYQEVFGISPSVEGHAGSLTVGRIAADSPLIAVLRGRYHLYEGHDWSTVTLPTETLIQWGVKKLIVTNAAGGLNQNFGVGDLMVLTGYRDHLHSQWQERGLLPALMQPNAKCENALTDEVLRTGEKLHADNPGFLSLQRGVYAGLLGPSYETLAEVEMLRRLKVDAVGMSTVPELLTSSSKNVLAAGISVITNVWSDEPMGGHEEVLQASKAASLRLEQLFIALFK